MPTARKLFIFIFTKIYGGANVTDHEPINDLLARYEGAVADKDVDAFDGPMPPALPDGRACC